MIRFLFVILAGFFILGTAATVYMALGSSSGALSGLVESFDAPVSDDDTVRVFTVPEGHTADQIGRDLEEQGLIRSALVFRLLVEAQGLAAELGSGEYELRPNMTTAEIARELASGGRMPIETFTIPEGWRAEEVALRLEKLGYASAKEVMDVVRDPRRIAPYQHLVDDPPTLEGYLFPDTYEIASSTDAEAVVEMMVRQFDHRFDRDMRERAQQVGLSLHEVVTLASIIEREAARPEERRLISGVFHNRLKADMPLQADPTVQYATASLDLGLSAANGFWGELVPEQLAVVSPYNTYAVRGLPPGPICSPGLSSLQAAIDPEQTDYLYFMARGDGTHVFAQTHDEHVRNIQMIEEQERASASRS